MRRLCSFPAAPVAAPALSTTIFNCDFALIGVVTVVREVGFVVCVGECFFTVVVVGFGGADVLLLLPLSTTWSNTMPMMIARTTRPAPFAAATLAPRAISPSSRGPPCLLIVPFCPREHRSLGVWVGSASFDAHSPALVTLAAQAFHGQWVVVAGTGTVDEQAERAVIAARRHFEPGADLEFLRARQHPAFTLEVEHGALARRQIHRCTILDVLMVDYKHFRPCLRAFTTSACASTRRVPVP